MMPAGLRESEEMVQMESILYLCPLLLCVGIFIFSTVGFFATSGKKEVLYGACSIVSAACAIVQMGIVF